MGLTHDVLSPPKTGVFSTIRGVSKKRGLPHGGPFPGSVRRIYRYYSPYHFEPQQANELIDPDGPVVRPIQVIIWSKTGTSEGMQKVGVMAKGGAMNMVTRQILNPNMSAQQGREFKRLCPVPQQSTTYVLGLPTHYPLH